MTLAETQALFHAAITGAGADPAAIEACFLGTRDLPVRERLEIYSGMWFWRQVDGLLAEFPALQASLGAERFTSLCRDYLREHPSDHHDIGRLGRALAPFLRRHPAPDRGDLADLAELEWARSEVFFEAESAPVGRDALAELGPGAFATARLRFIPAFRLLELEHPVGETLGRALRGEVGPVAPRSPTRIAVWRTKHEVFHAPIGELEALALVRAREGALLGVVCATFSGEEDPAASAFAALASWVDEGWVAGIEAGGAR